MARSQSTARAAPAPSQGCARLLFPGCPITGVGLFFRTLWDESGSVRGRDRGTWTIAGLYPLVFQVAPAAPSPQTPRGIYGSSTRTSVFFDCRQAMRFNSFPGSDWDTKTLPILWLSIFSWAVCGSDSTR